MSFFKVCKSLVYFPDIAALKHYVTCETSVFMLLFIFIWNDLFYTK